MLLSQYVVHSRAQALAAATVETLVQVTAPATRRLELVRWGISFDGVTASNTPVLVDLLRQTTAGTAAAFTPLKLDEADPASLASAQNAFTVEPTASDILESYYLTPAGGLFVMQYDPSERPVIAASGRMGIRANASAIVNATVWLVWAE